MNIRIEKKSGFCYGVVRAVEMADAILDRGEILYSLGQIVHNEMEVKRLEKKGLKTISREELTDLHDCRLLIRAHGEPPSTYKIAVKNRIEIIDGTCPIVRKIQSGIASKSPEKDSLIVIYGKKDHPEVEGLFGQCPEKTIIIGSVEEVDKLPSSAIIHVYSQTTMNSDSFREIISRLEKKQMKEAGKLHVHDTICRHVSHRVPGLRKFAAENDIIVFIGGKHSSNGKVLYQVCKEINPRSYYVSHTDEIEKSWFEDFTNVGIAGATSTPQWQIREIAGKISEITEKAI